MDSVEKYDPFAPGSLPVGVRTARTIDHTRQERNLPFEWWYPAVDQPRDTHVSIGTELRNAKVREGRYPLVLYSHTSNGYRRQSTFLCTHLASHGYVVAAADHVGNTVVELEERNRRIAAGNPLSPEEREALIQRIIADRVPDIRCLLSHLLSRLPNHVDSERVGLVGWSFGGWSVLATPEVDDRIRSIVVMAPAGCSKPLPGIIRAPLTFSWRQQIPTLFLVAERDQATPLAGMYELFDRTPSQKRMVILSGADHGHFGDEIDSPGRCSPAQAHTFVQGLTLAHFDAILKGNKAAQLLLSGDVAATLRQRDVTAIVYRP
jgi:dienelactone hydrolase